MVCLGGGIAVAVLSVANAVSGAPSPTAAPSAATTPLPGGSTPTSPGTGVATSIGSVPVREVASRVERIRHLRFNGVPRVEVLDPSQFRAQIQGIGRSEKSQAQKANPATLRRLRRSTAASQEVLRLTGLVPPDFDFGHANRQLGIEIGGVYDPTHKRILMPAQIVDANPDRAQIYLAHEMTHALDDQHSGLDVGKLLGGNDEASFAFGALTEGEASYVQFLYAQRYTPASVSATRALRLQARQLALPLTPALAKESLFRYVDGANFVAALRRRGGWALVSRADRNPPISSQQILHPAAYLADVRPVHVPLRVGPSPSRAWESVGGGGVGEEDTRVLLSGGVGDPAAARVASGWRGGRFEVWRKRGTSCAPPCRDASAAVLAWRWRSAVASRRFTKAAIDYARLGLVAQPAGPLAWSFAGGSIALAPGHLGSAIAYAPTLVLARRLAARAAADAQP